jgi:hypothetical protein
MNGYFVYTDNGVWHKVIHADTWSQALRLVREVFGVGGRLRIIAHYGDSRDYRLDGTRYNFTLRRVA